MRFPKGVTGEGQYLELLSMIFHKGNDKHPSRVESGKTVNATRGLANLHFSVDVRDGFPLLTTRRIAWKSLVGELRSFLQGHGNNEDFVKNGCSFWQKWAREDGDLGPVYGVQWSRHGQLQHVLDCLRNRPTDRRMVVSAWRPDEHDQMVRPPCHFAWVVTPYDGVLNLSWFQRSCDFPIGVPYNIASYALLLHLLSAWAKMEPGSLDCIFCDAHIYDNQVEGVIEQLKRPVSTPPSVRVYFEDPNDFHSWNVDLEGWYPLPNIDFGDVEV